MFPILLIAPPLHLLLLKGGGIMLHVLEAQPLKAGGLQQKRGKWIGVCKFVGIFVFGVVALRLVLDVAMGIAAESHRHISCEEFQPLVRVQQNFVPEDVFHRFQSELQHHPRITFNHLDDDGFGNTHGLLVKFNLEGLERLRSNPDFSLIIPYLDSVRLDGTNAYVLNLLIANQTQARQMAVKAHFDNTVAIHRGEGLLQEDFIAHQVNVLYTNIPTGIQGGQLQVWPTGPDGPASGRAEITPSENMMVAFRGDAAHNVLGFQSPSGSPRISLVFEQYKIRDKDYSKTFPYCENSECFRNQV